MMNRSQAIKGLNGYSEMLVSLRLLLQSKMFDEKSSEHENLLAKFRKTQENGKWLVQSIMKEAHGFGTDTGDMDDLSVAIERFVLAEGQVKEVLREEKLVPSALSLKLAQLSADGII